MAAPGGRADSSLEDILLNRGYEFDFFQAVRLLAWVFPDRKPVGGAARPQEEVARFSGMLAGEDQARLSLAFPASAIHNIEQVADSTDPTQVSIGFLGLTGTQGVLPLHYTDRVIANYAAKDPTLASFLDLFNHRLISLFYRAWEKHHPPVLYERASHSGLPDPFTQCLFDLTGMGTDGLRGRMLIPDECLLLYAGLIAQRPHSAMAVRGVLRDYFSVPVEIDQCLGGWYTLEDADRCYLSHEWERNQLGVGAFIGEEVWDQQARFRVRVGPLGLDRFRDFLPDGRAMAELVELTTYLAGKASAFDVQLCLKAAHVPYCRLHDVGPEAPRLGWMAWLKTADFATDAVDAEFAYVN